MDDKQVNKIYGVFTKIYGDYTIYVDTQWDMLSTVQWYATVRQFDGVLVWTERNFPNKDAAFESALQEAKRLMKKYGKGTDLWDSLVEWMNG